MSEAVKTPRMLNVKFKRSTPSRILRDIHSRYAKYIDDDDVMIDYGKTDLHKEISASMTPGEKLRELRLATGMTLKAVGEKIGVTFQRVNEYEAGRYGISKAVAKKLAELFGVSPAVFI
jgi:DNA-binding XRE family transcriptional regulator